MAELTSGSIPPGLIVDSRTNSLITQTQTAVSQEGTGGSEPSDAQDKLQTFWQRQMDEIQEMSNVSEEGFKTQELPLARIKKIMKMDEDVKMISAEAPLLFSKAAQMFITELSLRAWIHTEESKRRTLQRNDIATAITKFDQFDFLIDIVPREEIKPTKRPFGTVGSGDASQFFYSMPQQGSGSASNSINTTQTTIPASELQTGQLLLAQQNPNGQPMTLTPFNMDSGQVLQLAQPTSQHSQPAQQMQQQSTSLLLNSPTDAGNHIQTVQMQKQPQTPTQTNEQKQLAAQTILQQLVNNLPSSSPGGVHTIQINSQGQLQLVKVAQSQNTANTESQQLVTDGSQLFGLTSDTQQTENTIGSIYVNPE